MITLEKFNYIKEKHGHYASWAIWANQGDKPKSNIGDLSVLDPAKNENLLSQLKPNVIFVGLNISRRIEIPLANFHSSNPRATDFKIRFAFKNSPYWGGYMTDIIKDFEERVSGKVEKYLREHKEFERQKVKEFCQELTNIGAINPTLIAFGKVTFKVLKRNPEILKTNLNGEFKIRGIYHYAYWRVNKENYRAHVRSICRF